MGELQRAVIISPENIELSGSEVVAQLLNADFSVPDRPGKLDGKLEDRIDRGQQVCRGLPAV
ncbi:MAG: hypothetical protein GVY14_09640 [Spirochaetes bacterium]|nr:hypothetical protein [Spirochaetota bacterium]